MIRDPSDGTIKEITPEANDINSLPAKTRSEEITSGLPTASTKPKDLARLEKSREWLKRYFKRNPEQGT
jgi:hypothetical protein